MDTVIGIAIGVGIGLAGTWLLLVVALLVLRPRGHRLGEALRLLPDVLGLVRRLAGDRDLPRGVRVRLWLLGGYLLLPIDLVPDFVPVLGQADDVIVMVAVLRGVVRRAGLAALRRHWRGTDDGFAVLCRVAGSDRERQGVGDAPGQVGVAGDRDVAEPLGDRDPPTAEPGEQGRGQAQGGGGRAG